MAVTPYQLMERPQLFADEPAMADAVGTTMARRGLTRNRIYLVVAGVLFAGDGRAARKNGLRRSGQESSGEITGVDGWPKFHGPHGEKTKKGAGGGK